MRVLIVEDNRRLAALIAKGCGTAGFAADICNDLEGAQAALATTRYDIAVLDLGLPDGDGLDLLASLRQQGSELPVLVLTARDALESRVEGLNAGADDYLLKPFAMEELVARLRALLRRPGQALGRKLTAGNVEFDTVAREVSVGGVHTVFSRRETDLLEILLRRQGRVVPKDAIEEGLYAFGDEVSSNTIEVAIHRLRKRMAEAGADIEVHTLRGIGYVLSPAA
ncbi:response regulator transcription factor [Parvibaculum sp.]|jgi:DNA-binding response OmpR family regulator|uniref:response regulator n=1 Tax=Parvibaculum sp. TaxID=2024848 RepID=UPI001B2CE2E0|nr:response regulator transcription factor [Parvibaculum sp.]MBO6635828.1 response regulator transcription factor [Parvibaculum sp.]MBO6679362.1 response regulator transcription factor [Parvibaculum sp.]MBO6684614.1 response regulator transcription factor [Parvibaculum sp.]MBO6904526.1 response regulator transcription factor [Parvibaculum sp.]